MTGLAAGLLGSKVPCPTLHFIAAGIALNQYLHSAVQQGSVKELTALSGGVVGSSLAYRQTA